MAYIRAKSAGGDTYLYLVRSSWDRERRTSRQEIIKYLGKAGSVRAGDIPPEYRGDPKVAEFVASLGGARAQGRATARARRELFEAMTRGDLARSAAILEGYAASAGLAGFCEQVLRPVMYRIGDLWEAGRLGIAAEHISSNVAREIVTSAAPPARGRAGRERVLVCTPAGEEHTIGLHVIQSYLQGRGFPVSNMSPSAPGESVLEFVGRERPDVVLVSVTLPDSVRPGQRLADRIRRAHGIPVILGGQAVSGAGGGTPLDAIPRLIRRAARG